MKLLLHLRRAFEIRRRERTTVRELSRLGDRELADLGLGRADIRDVARAAARVGSLDVYAYHGARDDARATRDGQAAGRLAGRALGLRSA